MIAAVRQKAAGAYYTRDPVVQTLLKWAIHDGSDRFLDPSCGDGRFIAVHKNSVGIEQNAAAAHGAAELLWDAMNNIRRAWPGGVRPRSWWSASCYAKRYGEGPPA